MPNTSLAITETERRIRVDALRQQLDRAHRGETIHSKVWSILHRYCGARLEMPDEFVFHWPECREYRFNGDIGSGAKIWASSGTYYVSVYPEAQERMTPTNRALSMGAIKNANIQLSQFNE